MRDLLSKLDRILLEETTLQDLKKEPMARDPVIAKAIKDKEREESGEIKEDSGTRPQVHDLRHLEDREIYDETQTNDTIKDGDVIQAKDGIGILVGAWPVNYHGHIEGFHELKNGRSFEDLDGGKYAKSAKIAAKISDDEIEFGSLARQHNDKENAERSADLDAQDYHKEGYQVVKGIDKERYQSRDGLEGPFSAKNGKVVYYDPKEGKYYDPDTDIYIDHQEWQEMNENIFQVGDDFGISVNEDFEIGAEIVDILEDGVVIELDDDAIGYLSKQGFTFVQGELIEGKQHGNSKIYDKCWKGYKKVPGKARGEPGSCEKIAETADVINYNPKSQGGTRKELLAKYSKTQDPEDAKAARLAGATQKELQDAKKRLSEGTMDDIELYGLRIGDTVKTEIKGLEVQGDIIDIFPDTEEVELLLRGPEAGKTVTVDVRRTEFVGEATYQGREVPLNKPMRGDVKKSKVYVKNPQGNVVKVNFGDKKMRIKKSNPKRRKSFRARHNCANPGPKHKARYWSCRSW